MTILLILGVSALLSLVMMLAWAIQRHQRNASWVDVVWSFGLGLAGLIYALAPLPGQAGQPARRIMLALLVAAWSARLGLHLLARTRRGAEDARYAQFRRDWGAGFERRLFWFLQIQAAAAALLALCVLLAARNPAPLAAMDLAGLGLFALAFIGETLADAQLRRFRARPGNSGMICDQGLWGLSRHPNYFFEWLVWLAWPFFAIAPGGLYPLGWLAWAAPLFMYWLLVHVSGIPPLEQQMLRTRGDAYRAYQARTRPFLPWPSMRQS